MTEPRWLIGGPAQATRAVAMPQQAAQTAQNPSAPLAAPEMPEAPRGRYKGRTAGQWLDMATSATSAAQPWRAREYRLCADLAENDGWWEFPALFTLTGALVSEATWVKVRRTQKWVWRIGNGPATSWFDPSKAARGSLRRRNDAAKGFQVGLIRARGAVCAIDHGATVGFYIGRLDHSSIEIVDNGSEGTQYQDR